MRQISYGINSYYKKARIYFRYAPVWVFILDWLNDRLCLLIPPIPFPPIPIKLRDADSIEMNDGKEWTTWRNKWGRNLQEWFYAHNNLL